MYNVHLPPTRMSPAAFSPWQFVSQGDTPAAHLFYIQLALDAGCRWIQLRLKEQSDATLVEVGLVVSALCKTYKGVFILNDYVDLVKPVAASGVHLGLADSNIEQARDLLGPNYLIGGTANTAEDVARRIKERVDYIGLGPFRFTATKKKLSPVLGLQGIKSILHQVGNCNATCAASDVTARPPIYAIGGIQKDDLQALYNTGIYGVAISGWLTGAVDLSAIEKRMKVSLCPSNAVAFYQGWKAAFPAEARGILSRLCSFNAAVDESSGMKHMVQQYCR